MSYSSTTVASSSQALQRVQKQNEELRRYLAAQKVVVSSLERRAGRSLEDMGLRCKQLLQSDSIDAQHTHLAQLQSEVNCLSDLIADTLLLQKLEAGKVEVRLAPLDLRLLLVAVSRHLQAPTAGVSGRVMLDVIDGLPPALADQELVEAVLTDLIARGSRYSDPAIPVIIGTDIDDDRVAIKVTAQRFAPIGDRDFATEIVLCCRRIEVQGGEVRCQPGADNMQTVIISLQQA